jgi:hypothetical protein
MRGDHQEPLSLTAGPHRAPRQLFASRKPPGKDCELAKLIHGLTLRLFCAREGVMEVSQACEWLPMPR